MKLLAESNKELDIFSNCSFVKKSSIFMLLNNKLIISTMLLSNIFLKKSPDAFIEELNPSISEKQFESTDS